MANIRKLQHNIDQSNVNQLSKIFTCQFAQLYSWKRSTGKNHINESGYYWKTHATEEHMAILLKKISNLFDISLPKKEVEIKSKHLEVEWQKFFRNPVIKSHFYIKKFLKKRTVENESYFILIN